MKAPHALHTRRWTAISAVALKDFTAVRRSKGVVLPMLIVPFLLLVVLPLAVGLAARNAHAPDVSSILRALPGGLAKPILGLPRRERAVGPRSAGALAPAPTGLRRAADRRPAGRSPARRRPAPGSGPRRPG